VRGFLVKGDPKPAVESMKKGIRIYPLAKAGNPPETKVVNVSGKVFNSIHAHNQTRSMLQTDERAAAFSRSEHRSIEFDFAFKHSRNPAISLFDRLVEIDTTRVAERQKIGRS
jgi:hypothetical protein